MTLLVLSDLHVVCFSTGLVEAKKINKIFVVELYKRALDVVVPRAASLFLELATLLKYACHGAWNNTHAVIGVGWVLVEVDARHGEGLATTCLAIGEDGTVESFYETRD